MALIEHGITCNVCGRQESRVGRLGLTCNGHIPGQAGYCQGKLIERPIIGPGHVVHEPEAVLEPSPPAVQAGAPK